MRNTQRPAPARPSTGRNHVKATKGEESPKTDWFKETIGNLDQILGRIGHVFLDFGLLLWSPSKLFHQPAAVGADSLRPLVFFALAAPISTALMYLDRLLETLFGSARPFGAPINTGTVLGASLNRIVELIERPDLMVELLLPGFIVGLILAASAKRWTKSSPRQDALRAAWLYLPALAPLSIIALLEVAVTLKRISQWLCKLLTWDSVAKWLGDPIHLSTISAAIVILTAIGICARAASVIHSSQAPRKRWIESLALAFALVYLPTLLLTQLDTLRVWLLGDPAIASGSRIDLTENGVKALAGMSAVPLSLTNYSGEAIRIAPDSISLRFTYDPDTVCPVGTSTPSNSNRVSCSIPLQVLNTDGKDWVTVQPRETKVLRIRSAAPLTLPNYRDFGSYHCAMADMDIIEDGARIESTTVLLSSHAKTPENEVVWCKRD